ncbi:MAG: ATP-binding cassette domain-containing protein [Peptoniphilaceae bacterium]|nr:ATP-binding cassette domain-containing protein [Peptoniphilaceae bacterium]
MIEISHVSKRFGDATILNDISLSIDEGETVGFVGANGSGKSVLFKIIAGLYRPDEGSVTVRGQVLGKDVDFPDGMGILIDEPGYVDYMSGWNNLKNLALIQNKISDDQIRETMMRFHLDPNNRTMARNYSLGMKKKLGICQAIMENQDIIILDEPFNALDFESYNDIQDVLFELKEEGKTILITAHQHEDIESLCDRMFFVHQGSVEPLTEEIRTAYFERHTAHR